MDYRTFLPMFLMGGMLLTVLVIYVILFRRLKPYYSIKRNQAHYKTNGDVVELVEVQEEVIVETEVTSL